MHVLPKTEMKKAVGFIFLAALFNAAIAALAKISYSDLSAMQIIFARNFVSFGLFSLWLFFAKKQMHWPTFLRPQSVSLQITRAVAGFSSIALFVYALKTTDLSDAAALTNTMPIFLPIIAYLWKGIKIHHKTWWGIITAFVGVILVIQPGPYFLQQGSLFALLAGITSAISTLSLRFSHTADPFTRTLFYYFLICTALSAIFLLIEGAPRDRVLSSPGIFYLLGIGVLGLVFQLFFTLATKLTTFYGGKVLMP
jgi:drug/metabolite transporter (DMT)-like permease